MGTAAGSVTTRLHGLAQDMPPRGRTRRPRGMPPSPPPQLPSGHAGHTGGMGRGGGPGGAPGSLWLWPRLGVSICMNDCPRSSSTPRTCGISRSSATAAMLENATGMKLNRSGCLPVEGEGGEGGMSITRCCTDGPRRTGG
jgi:hypothetical protein